MSTLPTPILLVHGLATRLLAVFNPPADVVARNQVGAQTRQRSKRRRQQQPS